MNGEKNEEGGVQGKRRTLPAEAESARKAKAEAATWRDIATKAAADHSKRDGQFSRRLAELNSQGALARGFVEAKNAAKAWEAAAEKWVAGDHKQAKHFEEQANAAMMESLDGLDKADELWEMEQEEKSAPKAGKQEP